MTPSVRPNSQPIPDQPADTERRPQDNRTLVGLWQWCLLAVILLLLSGCIPGGGGGGVAPNPANLQSLEIVSGTQVSKAFAPTPAFNAEVSEYAVTVGSEVSSVQIIPTVADSRATVKVNNQAAASGQPFGPINLVLGTNAPITILVDAPGASKTYTITITRAATTTLSNLLLSAGSLQPTFEPNKFEYSAQAPFTTATTTVTPTTADSNATVTVNGTSVTSGQPSQAILLSVGQTTITIVVSAPSVAPTTYTVTVSRLQGSSNANLSALVVSPGPLLPAFSSSTLSYSMNVNNPTSSVIVTATVQDATSTLEIDGKPVGSGQPFAVNNIPVGASTITILVIPQTGTPKVYAVTVNRALPGNANLSSVTASLGTFSPAFSPSTLTYSLNVLNPVTSVSLTATVQDSTSTMTINGQAVASGTPFVINNLVIGNTTVTIVVTANPAGNSQTYTVTIVRSIAGNANLSGLTVTQGALTPAFNPGTLIYSVNVLNPVVGVIVTATVQAGSSTMTINGQGVASGAPFQVNGLVVGPNTVTIRVTAQAGNFQDYVVTVNRSPAGNANLSGLTVSAGILSPVFAPATLLYSVNVLNSVTSMTVTASTQAGSSTMTINGQVVANGTPFTVNGLVVGVNQIAIRVTAIEGNFQDYLVTVNRAAPGIANLSLLTIGPGTMTPSFLPATLSYSVAVANTDASVTVTATLEVPGTSTMTINNQAVASGTPLLVNLGVPGSATPISIVVTAQAGNSQVYTVTVNRPL
ncbi:MAG: cadherin-like beta sandwich domain-containing protein [Nitrospiraceae bacterium]